ncbi:MAG: hypothetical protein ACRD4B_05810 [Acidobacteriota bacterium]
MRKIIITIRIAIPGADICTVCLVAPFHINHEFIRGFKKGKGGLKWYPERSTQITRGIEEKKLEHIIVVNEDRQLEEIAWERKVLNR